MKGGDSVTVKVGVDVDDVLLKTTEAWLEQYNKITMDNVTPDDIKSWDIAQYIHKGNREMLFDILRQSSFWRTVDAVDDSVTYLWKLINENDDIDIYIVSATYPDTAAAKIRRLLNHFPFIDERSIVLTATKNIIDVDILIDDNPENLCSMRPGCMKILFDRPHNRWCDETGISAIRAKTWKEIYDYVTTLAWLESEEEIEA